MTGVITLMRTHDCLSAVHRMNSVFDGAQRIVDIDNVPSRPISWRLTFLLKRLVLQYKGAVLSLSLQKRATWLSAVRMLLVR